MASEPDDLARAVEELREAVEYQNEVAGRLISDREVICRLADLISRQIVDYGSGGGGVNRN